MVITILSKINDLTKQYKIPNKLETERFHDMWLLINKKTLKVDG